jgi:hypothetical protein
MNVSPTDRIQAEPTGDAGGNDGHPRAAAPDCGGDCAAGRCLAMERRAILRGALAELPERQRVCSSGC